jgi:FkbH-like protein
MSDANQLCQAARECLKANLPHAQAMGLARDIRKLDAADGFRPMRLSILATSNLDFLAPVLEVTALADRIHLKTQTAAFNQVDQQTLDPASSLYGFAPNLVLIAARAEDIVAELAYDLESVDGTQIDQWINQIGAKLNSWCAPLSQAGIQVVFFSFARPAHSPQGIREFGQLKGHTRVWNRLNDVLAEVAGKYPGVNVIDFEGLVRRIGLLQWEDPKLWNLARIAGGSKFAGALAGEVMPILRERAGKRRKCLVLDLDNTLWGGIIGEDGIQGVKLGGDYPGNIYREFQRRILDLWKMGVLLAVNSKNNPADAEGMITEHPEMLLRLDHFVSRQINWVDKVENLKAIAREVNIGLDSLVFVDDNPVEVERVRNALPEVTVFQVPADLAQLPRQFAAVCKLFEGVTVSEEDRQRNVMYQQNQLRESQMAAMSSVEEFLATLDMKAEVDGLHSGNLSRVVQLLHKTNQFNVTTRRHTEQFIASLMTNPDWPVYAVRLKDKFGDNGIVLIAIVEVTGTAARLDTFLMSCRVIGRTLEQAVIGVITADLRARGSQVLIGEYIPTAKNEMVADLFPRLGFALEDQSPERLRYSLLVGEGYDKTPEYLVIERHNEKK